MKPSKWLVLDCNYLSYRAFFAMGGLSFDSVRTGVIYGFLRDILILSKAHRTTNFAFCFDWGKNKRMKCCPQYKMNRHKKQLTAQEEEDRDELKRQVKLLGTDYLAEIGYKNICYQDGYEADDVIGSIVHNSVINQELIIVSADDDLYQLLGPNVSIYVPGSKKLITEADFTAEWGLRPDQWAKVIAISGGHNNLPGVDGVGNLTAAKYIRGELKRVSQAYKDIKAMRDEWKDNLPLARLPFEGCRDFVLKEDKVDPKAWTALTRRLGMYSIEDPVVSIGTAPGAPEFVSRRNRK